VLGRYLTTVKLSDPEMPRWPAALVALIVSAYRPGLSVRVRERRPWNRMWLAPMPLATIVARKVVCAVRAVTPL
jgi:hypothetical protein